MIVQVAVSLSLRKRVLVVVVAVQMHLRKEVSQVVKVQVVALNLRRRLIKEVIAHIQSKRLSKSKRRKVTAAVHHQNRSRRRMKVTAPVVSLQNQSRRKRINHHHLKVQAQMRNQLKRKQSRVVIVVAALVKLNQSRRARLRASQRVFQNLRVKLRKVQVVTRVHHHQIYLRRRRQ